jgi:hypothetical protein
VAPDLDALSSLIAEPSDTLDGFVSACLADAGVWKSPRTSDGVQGIERVLEHSPERLRICGRIWSIDQELHTFWLELQRRADSEITWRLCFDVVGSSPRRARNAVHDHDRPDEIEWSTMLAGTATTQDGTLRPVAGSTQSIARDLP